MNRDYAFKMRTKAMATRITKPAQVEVPVGTQKLLEHVKARSVVIAQEITATINAPVRVQQKLC